VTGGRVCVALATLLYLATAVTQALKGNVPMCIVWSGYAFANVGLLLVTE
jgi:flavoprotein